MRERRRGPKDAISGWAPACSSRLLPGRGRSGWALTRDESMAKKKVQVLRKNHFPDHPYFRHLAKGTENYQSKIYARAIEEWIAASRLDYSQTIDLKAQGGKVFCGSLLEELPFLFFLYGLYSNRVTGTCVVKTEDKGVSKKLVFSKGLLIRAATTKNEERIGSFILKRGLVSAEKLSRLIRAAKARNVRTGAYLIEKGILTAKDLQEILALQVEEIVSDILFWRKGPYYVVENQVNEEAIIKFTPLKIACIAAQRGFNFADFRKQIPNNKAIFRHSPYAEAGREAILAQLNANSQFIFNAIDGVRNIEQLIAFSGLDEVSIINILYRLNEKGLIRKTKEVVEYEDKEFLEISKVLDVVFEVYDLVTSDVFYVIGERGKEIVHKAKEALATDFHNLFVDVPLTEPSRMEKRVILKNIATYYPAPEQRAVFIDAFFGLYVNILIEQKRFLGSGLTQDTAKKISRIITNTERFSMDLQLKNRLLKSLTDIAQKFS